MTSSKSNTQEYSCIDALKGIFQRSKVPIINRRNGQVTRFGRACVRFVAQNSALSPEMLANAIGSNSPAIERITNNTYGGSSKRDRVMDDFPLRCQQEPKVAKALMTWAVKFRSAEEEAALESEPVITKHSLNEGPSPRLSQSSPKQRQSPTSKCNSQTAENETTTNSKEEGGNTEWQGSDDDSIFDGEYESDKLARS